MCQNDPLADLNSTRVCACPRGEIGNSHGRALQQGTTRESLTSTLGSVLMFPQGSGGFFWCSELQRRVPCPNFFSGTESDFFGVIYYTCVAGIWVPPAFMTTHKSYFIHERIFQGVWWHSRGGGANLRKIPEIRCGFNEYDLRNNLAFDLSSQCKQPHFFHVGSLHFKQEANLRQFLL